MTPQKTTMWSSFFGQNNRKRDTLLFLGTVPLFASLTKRELATVHAIAHHRTYQEDEFIFRKGQPGAAMFIVKSGMVNIVDHDRDNQAQILVTDHGISRPGSANLPAGKRLQGAGDARHHPAMCTDVHEQGDNTADSVDCNRLHILSTLDDNSFFGELALLDDSPRSASAVAARSTETFAFFRTDLERLLNSFPQIGHKVYRALAMIIGKRLKETNEQLLNK